MKRCTRCILPETYPNIWFDDKGVCNFCNEHQPMDAFKTQLEKKQKELEQIIESAKTTRREKNGPYDAIVPISGGKDSTYIAYLMKHIHGLKILALTYDNGMLTDYAKKNVWRAADKLDVDLEVIKPQWSIMRKMFSAVLRETNEFCNACNSMGYLLIASFIFQKAKVWGYVPLIVGGWVRRYEFQPGVQSFTIPDILNIARKYDCYEDLVNSSMIDEEVIGLYTSVGDPRRAGYSNIKSNMGLNLIQLPDYLDWDYDEIISTLKSNLDWEAPDGAVRATHFDCEGAPFKKYLKIKKWGFGQEQITSSHLIRDGRCSRSQALELAEKDTADRPPRNWNKFLEKLNISQGELRI